MNVNALIQDTKAYKIFSLDKKNDTLSHATLIVCEDGVMLEKYAKVFAKALMCKSEPACDSCRICNLIDKNIYCDCMVYPKDKKINVSDIDDIVEKTYFKPLENDKKLFLLLNVQDMNAQAQNKLLKTLEQPPENTYIIMAATTCFNLLPTVISRVKKLDINPFTAKQIENFFGDKYCDAKKLESAISLSNGLIGNVLQRCEDNNDDYVQTLAYDVLTKLKTSGEVYMYSAKINKDNVKELIVHLNKYLGDAVKFKSGTLVSAYDIDKISIIAENYSLGAIIYALDKIREIEKGLYFNANVTSSADNLLFGILEGKHKWLK